MATDQQLRADPIEIADETEPDQIDIKMDKRIDLALSIIVAGAGIFIVYSASHFRTGSFPDPLTPRGLPYITGGIMIAAGLFNAARRLLGWTNLPGNLTVSEGKEDDPAHVSSSRRAFLVMALALGWCALIHPLGYLIVTPPMLFGMAWLMNVRSPGKLYAFPIFYTLIIWVIFSQILHVILPLGPLTPLARALRLTP